MSERGFNPEESKQSEVVGKKEQSQRELNSILDKSLTVENINTYVDEALNSLIELTGRKVRDYKKENQTVGLSDKEVEDRVFEAYGLGEVNSILDHISQKAEEIRGLDQVISSANKINTVIVKPDPSEAVIVNGEGEFKEKRIYDRLKATLFILKEDFNVDVADRQQLMIQRGVISDNMVRKTSYYILNVYAINRTILVCDEEGNATYVFDSKALDKKGISNDWLINSTKSRLNDLIDETPELGKRVIYSQNRFVPRIIEAIEKPVNSIPDQINGREDDGGKYLYQKAPEDYLSAFGLASKIDIDRNVIISAIDNLEIQLGEVKYFRFKGGITFGYSPDQQKIILDYLNQQDKLRPKAPEGYLSIAGISHQLGLQYKIVGLAVRDIVHRLGEVKTYKFGGIAVSGYSPDQQKIILDYLNQQGKLRPSPPEDYLTINGISKITGLSNETISSVVKFLDNQLGEVKIYKFGNKITNGYSPDQQKIILDYLGQQGKLKPKAPEGYLSVSGIARRIGFGKKTIFQAINSLGNEIGEVKRYRFNTQITLGYSPDQQKIIEDYINRHLERQ